MFKIGDKVKVIDKPSKIENFAGGSFVEMDDFAGEIFTIENIRNGNKVDVEENCWTWDIRAFKHIVERKSDLKVGDIVTLRNGEKLVLLSGDELTDLDRNVDNDVTDLDDFNDDLERPTNSNYDIVKIERATSLFTVFEKEVEAREMTVEEISKALGYEVKVVKEKK